MRTPADHPTPRIPESSNSHPQSRIRCGIAGWSYPDWDGYVYPAGTRDKLRFCAEYFDIIEINSTFYRPPEPKTAASWLAFADTPDTRRHLEQLADAFGGLTNLTLELRHSSWQASTAQDFLREHYRGKETVNALEIKALLAAERIAVPPLLLQHYPQLQAIAKPTERTDLFGDAGVL